MALSASPSEYVAVYPHSVVVDLTEAELACLHRIARKFWPGVKLGHNTIAQALLYSAMLNPQAVFPQYDAAMKYAQCEGLTPHAAFLARINQANR